jgi:Carboxypeptidase regulatory-like domain/TonB dependent receptor
MKWKALVPILLLLSLVSMTVFAQQGVNTGSISGTVTDPSGAALSGVTVTATHLDRNQVHNATTDERGRFRFPLLAVGQYQLTVASSGFATFEQQFPLGPGAAVDVPLRMQIAQSEESIDVFSVPLIETARTQVASAVTPEEVQDLPLNGRNYLDLALLAPGTSRTNQGVAQRFSETSAVPGSGISISTQRNLANSFIVDGLSANDDASDLAGTFFSQEVIREFSVVRAGGMAEFGRASGGIINVVTHAGGNEARGSAYAFFRNDAFDAENSLSNTKLPLDQKQYGSSFGGPIVRDRTFFFGNVEQLRQEGENVLIITPANAAAINARLDAVGYAAPRVSTGSAATSLDTTNIFLRADHTVSATDQLTLRVNTYDLESTNARFASGLNDTSRGAGLENADRTIAGNNLWTVSDSVISETRAQITRSELTAASNDLIGPAVNIAGVASFGTYTNSPTARDIDLQEIVQNVMWARGSHSLKAGADVLRNRVRIEFPGAMQGVYAFSNLANFQAGRYSTFQQAFGDPETEQRSTDVGVFIQDEWRATPRVTVNGGLRYDVQMFSDLINTDTNNISPRLGAAWDLHGNGRSVLRLAAGLYYAPLPLRAVANAIQRSGTQYRIVQVTPTTPGAPVFPNVMTTVPAGVLSNIITIDPDIESARSDQFSVQYERQLGSNGSASVAYEHLRGHGIIVGPNINVPTTTDPTVPNLGRPNPNHANNQQYQSISESWYDGMTLSVSQRPVAWGSARLSYTFSKGLDTASNFFFFQPQDAHDIGAERARSDNDQRHRVVLSGTLTSPSGGQGLLRKAMNGWLFSYIYTYTSALPFNIQIPTDRNGDTNFNDRPAGVGRNAGEGFDYRSLDLRLSRTFPLPSGFSVEAIVDAFNVLNRANYQVPNNIITSPTFGQPTAVGDPRQIQLGVRVLF